MDTDNKRLIADAKQRVPTLTYSDLIDRTIIQIFTTLDQAERETRYIHFFAYGYCAGDGSDKDHRFLEYTWFIAPLQKVLNIGVREYESEYSDEVKQYIEDCSEQTMIERYTHYDAGECPLPISESKLDMNIPDGTYILLKC
jgi:hypothetical protein